MSTRTKDDDMPIGKLTRVNDFLPPPSQLAGREKGLSPQGTVPFPSDRIVIEGLRCWAYVGVPEEERRHRQRLLLDITLETPLARAGRTDNVRATVDYAAAALLAKRIAEGKPYRLVEAIAEHVATALLKTFRVESVTVRVRKFSVPQAESVGVEMTRSRP